MAAVAVGGALGALARWQLAAAIGSHAGLTGWPWGTFVVNVTGCFAIGVVLAVLLHHASIRGPVGPAAQLARPLLVTGFLGGYTTWSTFAVEATQLLQAHRPLAALAYVGCSLLGGLVAVALAARLTAALLRLTLPSAPVPVDADE